MAVTSVTTEDIWKGMLGDMGDISTERWTGYAGVYTTYLGPATNNIREARHGMRMFHVADSSGKRVEHINLMTDALGYQRDRRSEWRMGNVIKEGGVERQDGWTEREWAYTPDNPFLQPVLPEFGKDGTPAAEMVKRIYADPDEHLGMLLASLALPPVACQPSSVGEAPEGDMFDIYNTWAVEVSVQPKEPPRRRLALLFVYDRARGRLSWARGIREYAFTVKDIRAPLDINVVQVPEPRSNPEGSINAYYTANRANFGPGRRTTFHYDDNGQLQRQKATGCSFEASTGGTGGRGGGVELWYPDQSYARLPLSIAHLADNTAAAPLVTFEYGVICDDRSISRWLVSYRTSESCMIDRVTHELYPWVGS